MRYSAYRPDPIHARLSAARRTGRVRTVLAGLLIAAASVAGADPSSVSDLQKRVEALEQQAATARPVAVSPVPADDSLINFRINGAVVADFVSSNMPGTPSVFGGGKFLPIFLASYGDWLLFEGHMEIASTSDGATDTSLEYAQLDFLVNDRLTLVAGKFLSPIGQFQQAIHPPWINKLPDRPAGFVEDGGDEPLTEVGVMARGGFPIGSMTGTYAAYVGNGPQMSDLGPALKGFTNSNNGRKSFGGRLSLFILPHLEIGVSGMQAALAGIEALSGSASRADYGLVGADMAYTRGYWDLRGEFIRSHLDAISSALAPGDPAPTAIPSTTWTNWYAQAAYRLAGVSTNPRLARLEPVLRYSQVQVDGFDGFREVEERRWSAGLDYWFAPSVVAKIAYERRQQPMSETAEVFHTQLAFGF